MRNIYSLIKLFINSKQTTPNSEIVRCLWSRPKYSGDVAFGNPWIRYRSLPIWFSRSVYLSWIYMYIAVIHRTALGEQFCWQTVSFAVAPFPFIFLFPHSTIPRVKIPTNSYSLRILFDLFSLSLWHITWFYYCINCTLFLFLAFWKGAHSP